MAHYARNTGIGVSVRDRSLKPNNPNKYPSKPQLRSNSSHTTQKDQSSRGTWSRIRFERTRQLREHLYIWETPTPPRNMPKNKGKVSVAHRHDRHGQGNDSNTAMNREARIAVVERTRMTTRSVNLPSRKKVKVGCSRVATQERTH